MMHLPVAPLEGRFVRLEPYEPGLENEVRAALDCDPEAWSLFATSGHGEHFEGWWSGAADQMARGVRIAYALRDTASGDLIGTSSFLDIRPQHRGAEIGATFPHPAARSGRANPEAKLLMLAHAFS